MDAVNLYRCNIVLPINLTSLEGPPGTQPSTTLHSPQLGVVLTRPSLYTSFMAASLATLPPPISISWSPMQTMSALSPLRCGGGVGEV